MQVESGALAEDNTSAKAPDSTCSAAGALPEVL